LRFGGDDEAVLGRDDADFEAESELARNVEAWLDGEAGVGLDKAIVGEFGIVEVRTFAMDVATTEAVASTVDKL
jgi:hypothetical protein